MERSFNNWVLTLILRVAAVERYGERTMFVMSLARRVDERKVTVQFITRILMGGAILGPGGDEAIHAVVNAMASGGARNA